MLYLLMPIGSLVFFDHVYSTHYLMALLGNKVVMDVVKSYKYLLMPKAFVLS